MDKGKGSPNKGTKQLSLWEEREQLVGTASTVVFEELDARLLWRVIQILAARGASIQIGVTRDQSAWAVQFWDGKIPVKDYYKSTYDFNRSLAALVKIADGREISEEWANIIQEYGW